MDEVISKDDYFCEKHLAEFLSTLKPVNFVKIEVSERLHHCSVCRKEIGRPFELHLYPGLSRVIIS